jgi:hypothetical protein
MGQGTSDYPGLAYDSVQDRIVGWANGGDTNAVYVFDPDTKTCITRTFPGGPPVVPSTRGTFGRFQYFTQLNLFVVMNDWQQNAFTLRLTP